MKCPVLHDVIENLWKILQALKRSLNPMNSSQKCGQIIANLNIKDRLDEEWCYYCSRWYSRIVDDIDRLRTESERN